ncbi:MAG: MarR family transcriptional regulator [Terracoccus sp.]
MSSANPSRPDRPRQHGHREHLRLDAQVCYSMHTAARAFDGLYRSLLAEHGLSYPQYIALMTVGEHGPHTVGALGERLRLDSGTLSPLLKRMEAAGSVARHRDPADERRVLVELTPDGHARLDVLAEVPATVARRSGLSRAEIAGLQRTLESVTRALDA